MNMQVVDGSGTTAGTTNGLGNLIVGYNENNLSATRAGSHNFVVGVDHEYTSFGGVVAGERNTITGQYASICGGYSNTASGLTSSVTGGTANTASAVDASVTGGFSNTASASQASVSGGTGNTASGSSSSVSGGSDNTSDGPYTSICGGTNANRTTAGHSAIGPVPSLSITGP
jgi:hypothetical protein